MIKQDLHLALKLQLIKKKYIFKFFEDIFNFCFLILMMKFKKNNKKISQNRIFLITYLFNYFNGKI